MYGFFNRLNNKLTDIDIKYAQQIWGKREKIERIKSTKSRQNSYGITTTSTSITKQQYKNVTVIIIGIVSIFITIIISVLILVSLLCYRRKYYMQVSLQERN
jgi:predicted PurR-regulated permease PerM